MIYPDTKIIRKKNVFNLFNLYFTSVKGFFANRCKEFYACDFSSDGLLTDPVLHDQIVWHSSVYIHSYRQVPSRTRQFHLQVHTIHHHCH